MTAISGVKPPVGTPLNWADPRNRGLVCELLFWEGGGTKVYDASASGNHGTLTNITPGTTSGWCGGKDGPAIAFDGSNDYINVLDSASLNITGAGITFGARVFPTGSADYQLLVGKEASSTSRQYALYLMNGNVNAVYIALSGVTNITNIGVQIDITSPWVINKWNDVYCVYQDGVGGFVYLNGQRVYFSATWSGSITSLAGDVHIGSSPGNLYRVAGREDNVRIFNRALNQDEILDLHVNPYRRFLRTRQQRFKPIPPTFKPAWAVGASRVHSGFGS